MNCQEINNELVAFLKNELPHTLVTEVEAHLESCDSCREELESIKDTLQTLSSGLVTLEPSAALRQKLNAEYLSLNANDRLRKVRPASTSSRRLLTIDNEGRANGILDRYRQHLSKSPYVGVSIMLHAAIFLLVLGLPLAIHLHNRENQNNNDNGNVKVQLPRAQILYNARKKVASRALNISMQSGFTVDLSTMPTVTSANAVYLAGDAVDGCIWAHPVGGNGTMSEKAFLQDIGRENRSLYTRVEMASGNISIPEELAKKYLGGSREVVVLDLLASRGRKRLEIWPSKGFDNYMNNTANVQLGSMNITQYLAAIISGRR